MADLELGTKASHTVTITSVGDSHSERPVLGRRRTTPTNFHAASFPGQQTSGGYDGEEDTLTKIGNLLWKVHNESILTRYALYILPVAALLAIPLVLADTVYYNTRIHHVRMLGLFIWIEEIWVSDANRFRTVSCPGLTLLLFHV